MAKSTASSHIASTFASSKQGAVALAISFAYALSAIVFRVRPVHIAAGLLKLAVIVYTINCMVVGNCNLLSWTHVLGLALFCSADLFGAVHIDTALRGQSGGAGVHGVDPSHQFATQGPGEFPMHG